MPQIGRTYTYKKLGSRHNNHQVRVERRAGLDYWIVTCTCSTTKEIAFIAHEGELE